MRLPHGESEIYVACHLFMSMFVRGVVGGGGGGGWVRGGQKCGLSH